MSYTIVILPALSEAYSKLPLIERLLIRLHLAMAAEVASKSPAPRPLWMERAGVKAGTHRKFLGKKWIEYRLSDEEQTISLLDFENPGASYPLSP